MANPDSILLLTMLTNLYWELHLCFPERVFHLLQTFMQFSLQYCSLNWKIIGKVLVGLWALKINHSILVLVLSFYVFYCLLISFITKVLNTQNVSDSRKTISPVLLPAIVSFSCLRYYLITESFISCFITLCLIRACVGLQTSFSSFPEVIWRIIGTASRRKFPEHNNLWKKPQISHDSVTNCKSLYSP